MKKIYCLILFFFSVSFAVLAQESIEVKGKITGEDKFGIPGVSVIVKGKTGRGTATDLEGKFKIKVEPGTLLIFKYVGYITVEQKVPASGIMNIVLKEDNMTTGAVVVTGFQTEKQLTSPANQTRITAESMKGAVVPSIDAALQGRAAGLQITQSGGIAGGAVSARIRGTGSISGGSDPLWVIDGIPIITGAGGDGGGSIGGGSIGFQLNPIADINPADIEDMNVLKDAAATALYGARGSNGVILVTTKRGKPGKTRFSLNYTTGMNNLTNRVDLLNGPEYLNVISNAYSNSWKYNVNNKTNISPTNASNFGSYINGLRDGYVVFPLLNTVSGASAAQTDVNWLDQLLQQNARTNDLSFSGSGGNEKTTFFIGGSYRNEEGILKGNRFQRFGGRFNLDNIANDKLKIGIGSAVTYTINDLVPSGAGSSGQGGFGTAQTRSLPIFPIYYPDSIRTTQGNYSYPNNLTPFNPYHNAYGTFAGTNIVLTQDRNYASYKQQVFRNISNSYLEYKLRPDLSFRTEGGLDFRSQVDNNYQSRYLRVSDVGVLQPTASATDNRNTTINFNNNNLFSYKKLLDEDNEVTGLLGTSYQRMSTYFNGVTTEGFPNDNTNVVSAGNRQLSRSGNETYFSLMAYFTKLNYVMDNKYTFQVNARYEGSSRFSQDNRYGWFTGGGAGWIISEEDYFKNISWLSIFKLRASYGRTGNQAGLDDFQAIGYYATGSTYTLLPGTRPQRLTNSNLTWEKGDQFDASLDLGFFKNRIELGINFFNKVSKDLLLGLPVPPSTGIGEGNYFQNIGRMRNRGWELTFKTVNITSEKKDKSWTTDFNITFITNTVLNIGGLKPNEVSGSPEYATYVGKQVSTFYLPVWAGVDPQTGQEMIYRAQRDANGLLTGRVSDEKFRPTSVAQIDSNRVPLFNRSIMPKFYGGVTNTFRYKGWDLNVLVTFQYGNYVLDAGEHRQSYVTGATNLRGTAQESWKTPGDNTVYPMLYYNNAPGIYQSNRDGDQVSGVNLNDPFRFRTTSRFVHDASYIRLKTVSLGYNLPSELCKRMKLSSVRLFVNAQNLLTFTKFPGWDPEVMGNLQSNQERNLQQGRTDLDFPQIKVISGGFNLGF